LLWSLDRRAALITDPMRLVSRAVSEREESAARILDEIRTPGWTLPIRAANPKRGYPFPAESPDLSQISLDEWEDGDLKLC
jgi:hypothetical protein